MLMTRYHGEMKNNLGYCMRKHLVFTKNNDNSSLPNTRAHFYTLFAVWCEMRLGIAIKYPLQQK